ncbi:AraC family transcriptional regulator [Leptospira sp. 201903070]|uniref:AraC family transcriptional regulator n=1 Tax=Leptospira ainlahdjerensis TaxID=2810033 RepID=A0ABS2U9V5_9LEPT|nr:AraC family transcriptional regulator [Leptospira ainlahdjerensis]MBM9577147.1 AraC family transcriptional regulator [Leptospira ainlahdjerensis]
MKDPLSEISRLAAHATSQPTKTELPGVWIIQGEVPEHQLAAVYEPMIGFVVQGRKTISIGERILSLKAPSYFVITAEIPATAKVHPGKNGTPYLSVGLRLNQNSLLDLLEDIGVDQGDTGYSGEFEVCPATDDFIEVWVKMLRLLETPEHIRALAPVYEREILYRTLLGPQGWRLRKLSWSVGKAFGMHQAIRWFRENYTNPIDIKRLADKSGLGVTTFHRKFKEITGLSPIQFQKQLRLMEARKLLAFGGYPVSEAAYQVGYESASQFNREYSRFFGAPPSRDASRIRKMEDARSLERTDLAG